METGGKTKFSRSLLRDALALCVREVPGVARVGKKLYVENIKSKGIFIIESPDATSLIVEIDLCIEYGNTVADVSYRVQEAVINTAAQLTNRRISKVNVFVHGTKYKETKKSGKDNKPK